MVVWLVVSTHLKNISRIGSFPQVGVKIKNIWNHHLVVYDSIEFPNKSLVVEETEVAGPDGNNGDENSDYEPIVTSSPIYLDSKHNQGALNTAHLEILRFWWYKYWGEVDL